MDYTGIDYLWDYLLTGNFPLENFFSTHSGHFLIFPRLLVLPNLILNSFDITNLFYLQWLILSLTLYFIFLLLKQTDQRLLWLLIPISCFIYSPLINSNYWAFAILQWYLPALAITIIIYLLQKKLNFKIFISSTSAAIMATFSITAGIVAWLPWIVGIPYLNFLKNKIENKWLVLWILITVVVGSIYYYFIPKLDLTISPILFSKEGYFFIANFISAAFRLKYQILMILVGTVSILISFYCVYYFSVKKVKTALPWLLFILVGISSAVVTAIGRAHLDFHYGNEPYYVPLSQFFQIGLMVLIGLLILDVNQKTILKHKNFFILILYGIIISQIILLVPSYYAGWWRGEYYYAEKLEFINCFSLTHGAECVNTHSHGNSGAFKSDLNFEMINYWLENKMNIFGEKNFNQQSKEDLKEFERIWYNDMEYFSGYGKIETINEIEITNNQTITIEKPFIIIKGWSLDHNKKNLDSIFLMIDEKPFLKYDDFQPRQEVVAILNEDIDTYAGWQISFLSNYLNDGCHTLTLAALKDNNKIIFDQKIEICKNNS
jgi:hypothetical protein